VLGGYKVLKADCHSKANCSADTQCLFDNSNDGSIGREGSAVVESKPVTFGEGNRDAVDRLRLRVWNFEQLLAEMTHRVDYNARIAEMSSKSSSIL